MGNAKRTPDIRFKGFEEDWEQRKLGELCYEIGDGLHSAPIYDENGEYYFINGNNLVNGKILIDTTETKRVSKETFMKNNKCLDDKTILLSINGTIGNLAYYSDEKVMLGKSAAYLKAQNIVKEFLYASLQTSIVMDSFMLSLTGTTIKNLGLEAIKNTKIYIPHAREQQQIGTFFRKLDNLITLHQRKYDKLLNVKKAMLDTMFPKNGCDVPEIRFDGFDDAWEQRKLSEVLTSYTDPVEIPHTGYERLGIRSHAKGTFHSYVPAGHELQTAQMHKVAADKFIVNITFGWEHAVAVTDENDAGKLVSHRFPQFSLLEELDPKFLKYIILDENFRHHLWLASPGGAGRNRVLNLNEMLQYKIRIPSVLEQRQIADVLINLDNLITLHQRKLEKLKNIKKSMLEKMFV